MEKVGKKTKVRKKTKISIEGYSDFSQRRQYADISIDHLNQILEMHGFRKIHKSRKKEVVNAVDLIELMDSCRSTLVEEDNQAKLSRAFITMEEAVWDLVDLNWQECSVNSLETLNLKPVFPRNFNSNAKMMLHNDPAPIPKKKRSRRKTWSLNGLNNHSSPALDACGFESASANVRKKLPCRRKMIVRSDDKDDGSDFGSTTAWMTMNLARRNKMIGRSDDETGTAVC